MPFSKTRGNTIFIISRPAVFSQLTMGAKIFMKLCRYFYLLSCSFTLKLRQNKKGKSLAVMLGFCMPFFLICISCLLQKRHAKNQASQQTFGCSYFVRAFIRCSPRFFMKTPIRNFKILLLFEPINSFLLVFPHFNHINFC